MLVVTGDWCVSTETHVYRGEAVIRLHVRTVSGHWPTKYKREVRCPATSGTVDRWESLRRDWNAELLADGILADTAKDGVR